MWQAIVWIQHFFANAFVLVIIIFIRICLVAGAAPSKSTRTSLQTHFDYCLGFLRLCARVLVYVRSSVQLFVALILARFRLLGFFPARSHHSVIVITICCACMCWSVCVYISWFPFPYPAHPTPPTSPSTITLHIAYFSALPRFRCTADTFFCLLFFRRYIIFARFFMLFISAAPPTYPVPAAKCCNDFYFWMLQLLSSFHAILPLSYFLLLLLLLSCIKFKTSHLASTTTSSYSSAHPAQQSPSPNNTRAQHFLHFTRSPLSTLSVRLPIRSLAMQSFSIRAHFSALKPFTFAALATRTRTNSVFSHCIEM